jgi:hypothetical protein
MNAREGTRPGTLYWIDHYVVASANLARWADFMSRVVGAQPRTGVGPEARQVIAFQDITPCCHHGAMSSPEPLPPSPGLGKGLPRHGLYIRPEDVEAHLRRLDQCGVRHLDPVRTSAYGEEGISIVWEDPDANQFEFWAPEHMPEGAMAFATSVGVGRISHAMYESRDLERAADHFDTYCAVEPERSSDTDRDTLVLRLVGGVRVIYQRVDRMQERTGGWGKLHATHAALVVRDEDFWSNYERMWQNLPEWQWDREKKEFIGNGPDLPARTARHGSAAGQRWYDIRGRGDDWYDNDTNCFHFMGGAPRDRAFSAYEPHTMTWHLPRFIEEHRSSAR